MPPSFPESEDTDALLKELKEISNRYSSLNQSNQVTAKSSYENKAKDKELHTENKFLDQTNENSNLNQYWYSKTTIDTLCAAIRESCAISGGKRVAFLSTPSLFFSLSDDERESCALFDVRTSTFASLSLRLYIVHLSHFAS
jgi:hypothetical protein